MFFSKFAHFDVISVESQEAAKLLHNNPKLQKYKDSIIYQQNGVDAMRLSEFRIPFGQKENIVLHVGRIGNWQKATDVAIEAFSRICGDFPEWRLVIVGPMNKDGPGFAPETSKRVSNLGKVPKEELFRTYAKSKILFAPSRSEGLPAAALEAGYFGTVLLGSAMNSMKNQINNNDEFGDTCPIDDVKCFASKLAALMKGGDRLKEMSAGIAKHIETNFEWHAVCAQLEEEFNRVRQK